jgi:hypothetical protein
VATEDLRLNDHEQAQVEAEVTEIIAEHQGSGETFDVLAMANATERAIEGGSLDFHDPEYWRAVVAELRRRATEGC